MLITESDQVDLKTARRYVKNYEVHAGYVDDEKEPGVKKPDTRCIWFSKERLQAMLGKLDKEGGDGVRFYLIAYDKKYDTTATGKNRPVPPPPAYWGYNTLLMVSTKDSAANNAVLHRDYFTDGPAAAQAKQRGFIVTFVPENRGELCPPPANCSDDGALLLKN